MASGTFTYVSETRAKGRAEGRAEGIAAGEAKALLRLLKRRGIVVDDHSRRRIESCTDEETFDIWLDRAVDIQAIDQLFED